MNFYRTIYIYIDIYLQVQVSSEGPEYNRRLLFYEQCIILFIYIEPAIILGLLVGKIQ